MTLLHEIERFHPVRPRRRAGNLRRHGKMHRPLLVDQPEYVLKRPERAELADLAHLNPGVFNIHCAHLSPR
ncbi:MAG: hypothetical protein WDN31_14400 [Hyphomicrobium sp.]